MGDGPSERALEVANEETARLVGQGARAVILTGSHARGEAHAESDIDLRAVGEGPPSFLKRNREFLISIKWLGEADHRGALKDPEEVGEVVPGWRHSLILHDPEEIASDIKAQADAWDWSLIESESNGWVADEITDYAEEVHTLIGNLEMKQLSGAAAIRSQLALHLAQVLAVHHRILYESENDLWDRVAEEMGPAWAETQKTALGLRGDSFDDSCNASLQLFLTAARAVGHLLDDRQRAIVDHATGLAASFPNRPHQM
jgi:predicted nucleotidyltransferase